MKELFSNRIILSRRAHETETKNWGSVTRAPAFTIVEVTLFLHWTALELLAKKKINWPMSNYFWAAVCLINLLVCLDANTVLSWRLLLCGKFWSQELQVCGVIFSLPELLWPFWVLWIFIDRSASDHQFLRKQVSCSDFDCLESINQSRKYCLNYIKFPSPWTWYISQSCTSSLISALWTCCPGFYMPNMYP